MEIGPVRITISDRQQTVSFVGSAVTALRLAAACSAGAEDMGELLAACDIYEPGLATDLMAAIMEFDKEMLRSGPGFIHETIRSAEESGAPVLTPFQVIDEATQREATAARGCEVMHIDLPRQDIRTSPGLQIPFSGEVPIQESGSAGPRRVTFVLPGSWKVGPLEGGATGAPPH